jgi:hypothetical protein
MLRHTRRLALFVLVAGLPTLMGAAGCRRGGPDGEQGSLSIPPPDNVRIVSRKIVERAPERLHWKWSVIGERNWTRPQASGGQISLDTTYPLNDPLHAGGCNIWECDLTAEQANGAIHWGAILHGSNGMTVKDEGSVPSTGGGPESIVRIEIDQDTVERLPADLELAAIGDRTLRLRIER